MAMQANTVSAKVPGRKTQSARMTKRTTPQAAAVPAAAASKPAVSPSSPNSTRKLARICARVAPMVFSTTASRMRRLCPAATAPASTSKPAASVIPATAESARPMRSSSPTTWSKASRTRMPVTFGKRSVSSCSSAASCATSLRMVAICVCGAAESNPGEATST